MRRIIRLGDSTSHGGKVVSATSHVIVGGIPVARLGDKCTCPKRGHNNCVIVEGDPNWTIDGIPVALEGHKISCGAVLVSSMPNAGRVYEGDGAASGAGISSAQTAAVMERAASKAKSLFDFDEQTHLVSPPIEGVPYYIETMDGRTFAGRTGPNGQLPRVGTSDEDEYIVLWGDDALAQISGENA